MATTPALRTAGLLDSFGVNTHIGNAAIAHTYSDIAQLVRCIRYLGSGLLRDGSGSPSLFRTVGHATGNKFVLMIGESPPTAYASELGDNLSLAADGLIAALEGPNEPDADYARSVGGSPQAAAAFAPLLYNAARSIGVPAIINSFGVVWPDPGSYGTTGDLSPYADFGNAHIYFDPHQCGPNGNGLFNTGMIDWIVQRAALTAVGRHVACTEFGWRRDHNSDTAIAEYVLTFLVSAHAAWRMPMAIAYALYDDISGQWGLFNDDGSPRLVATAIRNLFKLLGDAHPLARSFAPVGLDGIKITGLPSGENANAGGHSALYQKANGEYWLILWNEQRLTTEDGATPPHAPITVPPVRVTVTLPSSAAMAVYDPLQSVSPIATLRSASSFAIPVPAHPVLCCIIPG